MLTNGPEQGLTSTVAGHAGRQTDRTFRHQRRGRARRHELRGQPACRQKVQISFGPGQTPLHNPCDQPEFLNRLHRSESSCHKARPDDQWQHINYLVRLGNQLPDPNLAVGLIRRLLLALQGSSLGFGRYDILVSYLEFHCF